MCTYVLHIKILFADVLCMGLRTGVSVPYGKSISLARKSASTYKCGRKGSKKSKLRSIVRLILPLITISLDSS